MYLRAADAQGARRRDVFAVMTERFALPFDDARLAMDRVIGGVARAASGNPGNEPDRVKDPLAWMSYRLELRLPVDDDVRGPSLEERASAEALLERARRGEPTHGTDDVAVALEVARFAVASQEPSRTHLHLLLEAATSLSVAAEACIARFGGGWSSDMWIPSRLSEHPRNNTFMPPSGRTGMPQTKADLGKRA